MSINSFIKKSILAVMLAFGSVVWLTFWHKFGYGYRMEFPPISNWTRDVMIILLPVMLAVWVSAALTQWIARRSSRRISPWSQSMILVAILGGLTTISIILVEANRIFLTGIGNEVAIQISLCRKINPDGSLLLKTLLELLPSSQALRYHVLLRDGIYLALINVGITIVLILFFQGLVTIRNSRLLKPV